MEFKLKFMLISSALFAIILTSEGQVFKKDLTMEVLCKELSQKAKESNEFKVFCSQSEDSIKPPSGSVQIPKGGR